MFRSRLIERMRWRASFIFSSRSFVQGIASFGWWTRTIMKSTGRRWIRSRAGRCVRLKSDDVRFVRQGCRAAPEYPSGMPRKNAVIFEVGLLDSGHHSQPADTRKLQRGPANIEAHHRAQEIDFQTFDPTDGEAQITSEGGVCTGT